jgi:hypothetical protein
MRNFPIITLFTVAVAAPFAYGVDEHHPEKAGPAAKAAKAPAKPKVDDKAAAQMQDHMKKMQDIMARLQKTTDPAERKKLMDEHTKVMQEGMQMMRGMGGGMMSGAERWNGQARHGPRCADVTGDDGTPHGHDADDDGADDAAPEGARRRS